MVRSTLPNISESGSPSGPPGTFNDPLVGLRHALHTLMLRSEPAMNPHVVTVADSEDEGMADAGDDGGVVEAGDEFIEELAELEGIIERAEIIEELAELEGIVERADDIGV